MDAQYPVTTRIVASVQPGPKNTAVTVTYLTNSCIAQRYVLGLQPQIRLGTQALFPASAVTTTALGSASACARAALPYDEARRITRQQAI
jgi:hypothetical protein